MPYIDRIRRNELDGDYDGPKNPGELNYVLSRVCVEYVEKNGLRYTTINDVIGALDGASKEFYRRVAAPYEDGKKDENGDVYEHILP